MLLGYGDIAPTSVGGRVLACVCAFTGIVMVALPIGVMGSTFSEVF